MAQSIAVATVLAKAGLRPTAKRVALARLLFDGIDKHVTAEDVMDFARKRKLKVSQATVYNALNQFSAAGLLKRIVLDGSRTVFDTNITEHHHIYYEDDGRLVDLPGDTVAIAGLPQLKDGEALNAVEILVRVGRQAG